MILFSLSQVIVGWSWIFWLTSVYGPNNTILKEGFLDRALGFFSFNFLEIV